MDTTATPKTTSSLRLVALALALLVGLVAGALGAQPAGAAPPGAARIVAATGYDVAGPTSTHRLVFAPENTAKPVTGYVIERWNSTLTQKVGDYSFQGAPIDPTRTIAGLPDGTVSWYRVRTKNVDGWGAFGGYTLVATPVGQTFHRPFASTMDLVERQLFDFWGPNTGGAAGYWTASTSDTDDVATFIDHLATDASRANRLKVVRLYLAYFDRAADPHGLDFWEHRLNAGLSTLTHVSASFANSPEFKQLYGGTSNSQFVTLVYQNVLDRNPEPAGLAYWKGRLDQGTTTRGQLMIGFSESGEGKLIHAGEVATADLWATMMRDTASDADLAQYGPYVQAGGSVGSLATMLLAHADYAAYIAD